LIEHGTLEADAVESRLTTESIYEEKIMKFLSIYKHAERGTPPTEQEMATMGKLVEQGFKEGWLLATEGCLPSALGARVRRDGTKVSVTDGPFTESKEVVGGFAILKANSKEEAIQLTKDFLKVAGEGECELRQIYEQGGAEVNCVTQGEVALKA
jgi:hypothetical protein